MIEKILIVDDEPNARAIVAGFLKRKIPGAELLEASGVEEALNVLENNSVDLAMLDINLGEDTSFDLLNRIGLDAIDFKIIFISAYNQYAITAFKFSAIDYLLKPINPFEFEAALDRAMQSMVQTGEQLNLLSDGMQKQQKQFDKIVLRGHEKIQLVAPDEIVYCQSDNNYTTFYLTDNTTVIVSQTLKEYDQLLRPLGFFRTHRSYLINLNHLRLYDKREGGSVQLRNGVNLPLARGKKEALLSIIEG